MTIRSKHTKIFIAAMTTALVMPAAASAHCGTVQGSFAVTCEKGVQVYRHQALSGIPKGLSRQQAQLEAEKIRAKTARAQIAAQSRAQSANRKLRQRELAIQDYRARVYDRNTRGQSRYASYGGGYGFSGFNNTIGSPIVRPVGLSGLPNTGLRNRGRRNAGARNADGRNMGGRNTNGGMNAAAPTSNPVPAGRPAASRPAKKRPSKKH